MSLMKYILIGFAIILFGSCKFKNTQQQNSWENNIIMQEYPWALNTNKIKPNEADSIFDLIESLHGISFSRIVINESPIRIKYTYGQYNEKLKEENFIIYADDSTTFSAQEILMKINNETSENLKNDPHYFFEGLEYQGYQEGIVTYQIMQGS